MHIPELKFHDGDASVRGTITANCAVALCHFMQDGWI